MSTDMAAVSRESLGPDIDCTLCSMLLYEPVSLACGHSFCKSCLKRAFHYQPLCPLCRVPVYHSEDLPVSICLRSVLQRALPEEYAARRKEMEAETAAVGAGSHRRLPLFILNSVVFPGTTNSYCIFEPRYRLMLRRVMNGSRKFGIAGIEPSISDEGFAQHSVCKVGCVVEVTKCEMLPDGRSLIETIARDRFTILDRESVDGYVVARVASLVDEAEDPGNDAELVRHSSDVTASVASGTEGNSDAGVGDNVPGEGSSGPPGAGNLSSGDESAAASSRASSSVAAYARRLLDEVLARESGSWARGNLSRFVREAGPPPAPEEGSSKLGMWLADTVVVDSRERQRLLEETNPTRRLIAISKYLEQANQFQRVGTGGFDGCAIT